MSYMKTGRAAKWVDTILCWEQCNPGQIMFADWPEFLNVFRLQFFPVDEAATAINILESKAYYQNARNVDDYLNKFRTLIMDSGYSDPKIVVIKFRRGLQPSIQNAIATMSSGRPDDRDFEGWFMAARHIDQAGAANEAFQSAKSPVLDIEPLPDLAPLPTLDRPAEMPPAAPQQPICPCCDEPNHIVEDCPLQYDACYMTQEEKDWWTQTQLKHKSKAKQVAHPPLAPTNKFEVLPVDEIPNVTPTIEPEPLALARPPLVATTVIIK